MIHPHTELRFINETIGYGVVATQFIPKGTITWALDALDRTFSKNQVLEMPAYAQEALDKYTFRNSQGDHVLCWDLGRFVNHSFKANCLSTAYDFELAVRDIYPGEELTDDYGYLNITEPFEALPEKGVKRKMVYPDDLLRHSQGWDKKLRESFKHLLLVEQPLKPILTDSQWVTAVDVAMGRKKMKSIRANYFDPDQPSPHRAA